MLRVLAVLVALCSAAHSEESIPSGSKDTAEIAQTDNRTSHDQHQITVPAHNAAPTIINIYAGKHTDSESQCAKPKDWKEWAAFVYCNVDVWLDAERTIALFTVVLAIATGFLWWATRGLVKEAKESSKRQLRAYVTRRITGWRGLADGRRFAVQMALIAHGQTPAKRVKLLGKIDILPFPLAPGYEMPEVHEALSQPVIVFPNEANPPHGWITAERPFTVEEIAEITSPQSTRRAYMFGRITYLDIFNEERETIFRAFVDPNSIERDDRGNIVTFIWATAAEGNDFR